MSFIWPFMLVFLLVIPFFAWLYIRLQQRRRRGVVSFTVSDLGQRGDQNITGYRRVLPSSLFFLGLTILVFSLARPQTVLNLPRQEGTVILAFDVSGSMAADDIKPTRLEAAKTAAKDFVNHQPTSVQIGVVAFSDSGFAVQAPTTDQAVVLAAIGRLTPLKGTSLANGITASLNTIASDARQKPLRYSNQTAAPTLTPTPVPNGTYSNAVVVLLTDGDNNENPNPLAAAQTAADRGVRIYTVGIGSPSGTDVHINGFTMHTQLDEATLKQISQLTGGSYFNAENAQDLFNIYDHLDPQFVLKPEKMEITSLLAGASLLILLIGGALSLLWFNRLP